MIASTDPTRKSITWNEQISVSRVAFALRLRCERSERYATICVANVPNVTRGLPFRNSFDFILRATATYGIWLESC
jgi:hypothetical protein